MDRSAASLDGNAPKFAHSEDTGPDTFQDTAGDGDVRSNGRKETRPSSLDGGDVPGPTRVESSDPDSFQDTEGDADIQNTGREDARKGQEVPLPREDYSSASFRGEAGRQLEPTAPNSAPACAVEPSSARRLLRELAIISLLAFAAIWGTLTREGLVALNTYSGQSISPLIWAQAIGCLVMGWAVANKEALELW